MFELPPFEEPGDQRRSAQIERERRFGTLVTCCGAK